MAAAPGRVRRGPGERVLGPSLVSTLFPRLPRSHLGTFRIGLAIGLGLVGGLTLAGLYPVALGVAAAIVPTLILVYVYTVDVYEDEPATVLAATVLWGVLTGGLFGFASAGVATVTPGLAPTPGEAVLRGVALPLLGAAIALVGPLLLVRRRAYNDVLDGVTFGAAAGSAFVGAQTLAGASDLLSGGLRPVGAAGPWLVQLLTVGVAQPILSASIAAIVAGTIWLRIRAPVRDRAVLGLLGDPLVTAALGGAALAAAGLGRIVLGSVAALVWIVVLAVLALVWMRLLIHLGLLAGGGRDRHRPADRLPGLRRADPAPHVLHLVRDLAPGPASQPCGRSRAGGRRRPTSTAARHDRGAVGTGRARPAAGAPARHLDRHVPGDHRAHRHRHGQPRPAPHPAAARPAMRRRAALFGSARATRPSAGERTGVRATRAGAGRRK